jgi:hypothetical protein
MTADRAAPGTRFTLESSSSSSFLGKPEGENEDEDEDETPWRLSKVDSDSGFA